MSAISAVSSAANGVATNLGRLETAAARIARQTPGSDLTADIVDLKVARHGVAVNTQVFKMADSLVGTLIDMLA